MPQLCLANTKLLARQCNFGRGSIICGLCIWDVLARALVAASDPRPAPNHQALLEESDVRSQVCDRVTFFLCGLRDFGAAAAVKKIA